MLAQPLHTPTVHHLHTTLYTQRIAAGLSYAAMMGEARAKSNGFRPCTRHIAWGCPEYVCVIERAGPVLSDVPSKELLLKWNKTNALFLDEQ